MTIQPAIDLSLSWDNLQFTCGGEWIELATSLVKSFLNTDLKDVLSKTLNEKITEAAKTNIALPQEYRPIESIIVGYQVTDLSFERDKFVRLEGSMNISAVFDDGVRKYYEFPGFYYFDFVFVSYILNKLFFSLANYHSITQTPNDWSALLEDKTGTPLLNGARFNIDIVTAVAGAFSMLFSTFSNSTQVVDAVLAYEVVVSGPLVSVSERNTLVATLPVGRFSAHCDTEPQKGKSLLDATFNNVEVFIASSSFFLFSLLC